MDTVLIALQLLLLLIALPLLATSLRTSRARRSRHSGFLAIAVLLLILALIGTLLAVAHALESVQMDYALLFTPPAFTVLLCFWVVWRAMSAPNRPQVTRQG